MGKGKKPNRKLLYYIPFFIQLIAHIVSSGGFEYSTIENFPWRVLRAILVTGFAMLLGEGYGSIAFIFAGSYDRIGTYVTVIILSIIGAGANLAGYMISGIEGLDCLWMTLLFWCIDLFLFIYSIRRISQLPEKKKTNC
ncbi:MAG: hypothetical protein MJ094_09560 [Saccharofermentans sp.]|nr:hypothetical protein [Saccharofermentans sp.]